MFTFNFLDHSGRAVTAGIRATWTAEALRVFHQRYGRGCHVLFIKVGTRVVCYRQAV